MEQKCALVTGASRGIGRAVALGLAEQGHAVVVNYVQNAGAAQEVVAEIEKNGGKALAVQADVADFEQAAILVKAAKDAFGSVDILVNNAGITRDGLLMRMPQADFDTVLDTNLKGAFNCLRHVSYPMMKNRWGRVVNITSVAGIRGSAGQVNYSAAKAGMIGLTKSAARELASRGITVNAVAPGLIETEMTGSMNAEAREKLLQSVPQGRMGRPEEVAALVVFLCSDQAAYITGQVVCIDGGIAI